MTKKAFVPSFFLILFLPFISRAVADEYGEALNRAKSQDKPLVLYFYSQSCEYCEAMDKDVFQDKEIGSGLASDTVYLRLDVDKRNDIARRYNVRRYPTVWLLDPSGGRIVGIPGYMPKKNFKKLLAFLKGKHYKKTTLWDYLVDN